MAGSLSFLLVTLLAVQGFASVVREEQIARLLPEGRANTVTTYVTSTASGPTTTTVGTTLYCASLVNANSTTACRKKRQFWGTPLFVTVDDGLDQFNPSPVLKIEPSAIPEFRNRLAPAVIRPIAQFASPYAIQPTQDKLAPVQFRVADPFFGAYRYSAFSSLFSNIISSILTPAVTVTRTSTVYTSTATSLTYSSTVTYTLGADCIPAGVVTCAA